MKKSPLSDNYAGTLSLSEEKRRKNKRSLNHFSGLDTFADGSDNLTARISITNSSTSTAKIALFTGLLNSVAQILAVTGKSVSYIATHGYLDTAEDIEVNCEQIKLLQDFFTRNPQRISEMQINVDNQAQLSEDFSVTKFHPCTGLATKNYRPQEYQRPEDSNTNLVNIKFNDLQLDDQTLFVVNVAPGRTLALTMFLGASVNTGYTLYSAATRFNEENQ